MKDIKHIDHRKDDELWHLETASAISSPYPLKKSEERYDEGTTHTNFDRTSNITTNTLMNTKKDLLKIEVPHS